LPFCCHPRRGSAVAVAVACPFVVIPAGDLLLQLLLLQSPALFVVIPSGGPRTLKNKLQKHVTSFGAEKLTAKTPHHTSKPPRSHHKLPPSKHPKSAKPPAKTSLHHNKKIISKKIRTPATRPSKTPAY
jgi:hypothetical protein